MAEDELQEIVLIDDDGQEHTFHLLEVVEVDERRYALLQPTDEIDEEDDGESAYLFRIESDADGDDHLVAVEDNDEFYRVALALEEHDHDHDHDHDDEEYDEYDEEIDG